MSVHICRNCRNFKDGKCFCEKRRAFYRANGSVALRSPASMGADDGCDYGFEDRKDG